MDDLKNHKRSQKNSEKKDLSESGKSIDISSPSENPFSIGNTVNSSSSNNKGQSSMVPSSMAQSDSCGSSSPHNIEQYKQPQMQQVSCQFLSSKQSNMSRQELLEDDSHQDSSSYSHVQTPQLSINGSSNMSE